MSETDAAECSSYGRRLRPMSDPDLITWLRARLDDEERVARAAAEVNPPPWWVSDTEEGLVVGEDVPSPRYPHLEGALWDNEGADRLSMEPATARHVVRQDPAATLARVEAHRRIVDQACERLRYWYGSLADADDEGGSDPSPELVDARRTLRLLASAYADQPGWREEWR